MGQTKSFWDRHAARYAKSPVADEDSYQRKLKVTREYLRPDMEILELGCGTGSTALVHAPNVKHIRGIDISTNMIEIARAKAAVAKVVNVDFEVSSIDELEVPDQSCDVVMGHSILHLVENKEAVVARVYDILKPGGIFVTTTTCLAETMKFFKYIGPVGQFFGLLPVLRVFSVDELRASMVDVGFAIDHQWQPGRGKSVFIVAKKADA